MAMTRTRRTRMGREERKRQLLSRFEYARSYRQSWEDRAIEWYKLYIGYRERAEEGRSNLHIPRTYEQIDTLRARIVRSFFAARPYLDFIPKPDNDMAHEWVRQANEAKAKVASSLADDQLEKNQIYRLFYDWTTNLLISPLAIMSVGWRYEERTVRRRVEQPVMAFDPWMQTLVPVFDPYTGQPMTQLVVVEQTEPEWDDNELQVVDFFDFWPDPKGHDVDSCRFVFQREWLTRDQIEAHLGVLEDEMESVGGGQVWPIKWDEIEGQSESLVTEGKYQRLSAVGLAPDPGGDEWEEGEKPGQVYEVLHYWTDDHHGLLINRSQLAYYGDNPYWRHGKKPYVMASFDPLPNEPYGMSAVQVIEHLQHELNTLRNQRIDNVSMVLNRMWMVLDGADIDESQLVSKPHGVIRVPSFDVIKEVAMTDVTGSAYNEEGIVKQDMENSLGTAPVVRGVPSGRAQTATEIMNQTASAGIRFDVKIQLYERLGLSRLAYLMDCNNQQFIDTPRLVRLYQDDDAWEWRTVQPGELVGEHDYRPSGSNVDPAANREVRRQQLFQMIEMAARLQLPHVKLQELIREWFNTFDLRNPDKFLMTDEEIQQQMMMAMLMQGQGGGAPGMGGAVSPMPPAMLQQALAAGPAGAVNPMGGAGLGV